MQTRVLSFSLRAGLAAEAEVFPLPCDYNGPYPLLDRAFDGTGEGSQIVEIETIPTLRSR
jgi:hypothetical protein